MGRTIGGASIPVTSARSRVCDREVEKRRGGGGGAQVGRRPPRL